MRFDGGVRSTVEKAGTVPVMFGDEKISLKDESDSLALAVESSGGSTGRVVMIIVTALIWAAIVAFDDQTTFIRVGGAFGFAVSTISFGLWPHHRSTTFSRKDGKVTFQAKMLFKTLVETFSLSEVKSVLVRIHPRVKDVVLLRDGKPEVVVLRVEHSWPSDRMNTETKDTAASVSRWLQLPFEEAPQPK